MKVDNFANRLRAIMKQTNMNAAHLSKRSGVSTSTLSQYLSGKYAAKQERVAQLAELFGCDPLWLEGYDVAQRRTEPNACCLPVADKPVRDAAELSECDPAKRELACSVYDDGEHYYLRIKDDGLRPMLSCGDLVLVKICERLCAGQIGVFSADSGEFIVRQLIDDPSGYHIGFPGVPECPAEQADTSRLRVAGRVVYAIKKW